MFFVWNEVSLPIQENYCARSQADVLGSIEKLSGFESYAGVMADPILRGLANQMPINPGIGGAPGKSSDVLDPSLSATAT